QHYLIAALILMGIAPPPPTNAPPSMSGPLDPGNPYLDTPFDQGFVTFGDWHVLTLLAEVVTRALKAVWYQKWYVHRRLRPEEFGGRIHHHRAGNASYPINAEI